MSYFKTNAHLCSFFLQVVKDGKYLELTIIDHWVQAKWISCKKGVKIKKGTIAILYQRKFHFHFQNAISFKTPFKEH